MCWCTPSIRTPFCGKPGCHPPTQQAEVQPTASTEAVTLVLSEINTRAEAWAKASGIRFTAAQVAKQTDQFSLTNTILKLMMSAYTEGFYAGATEARQDQRTDAERASDADAVLDAVAATEPCPAVTAVVDKALGPDDRLELLSADAEARQRGLNLDGSERREAITNLDDEAKRHRELMTIIQFMMECLRNNARAFSHVKPAETGNDAKDAMALGAWQANRSAVWRMIDIHNSAADILEGWTGTPTEKLKYPRTEGAR